MNSYKSKFKSCSVVSIILYMPKRFRVLDRIPKSVSVLDMAAEVTNARVEDITQRILPKEEIT